MYKHQNILKIIASVLMVFLMTGCNNDIKFDKNGWNESTDPIFPSSSRPHMLKDLLSSHKLVGLNITDLTNYIGKPDLKDSNSISYNIKVEYDGDIDPVYTKLLIFSYSKDSLVTSFKIQE